jgi:hypothetical protein
MDLQTLIAALMVELLQAQPTSQHSLGHPSQMARDAPCRLYHNN